MSAVKLTVSGRIPSKKNSRNIFVKNGRQFNIPSADYAQWHRQAAKELLVYGKVKFDVVQEIQIEFFMPDKRACDLTNKAESIMDLMVDAGIISDDSWQVVPKLFLHCSGTDKENPRAEIWIR